MSFCCSSLFINHNITFNNITIIRYISLVGLHSFCKCLFFHSLSIQLYVIFPSRFFVCLIFNDILTKYFDNKYLSLIIYKSLINYTAYVSFQCICVLKVFLSIVYFYFGLYYTLYYVFNMIYLPFKNNLFSTNELVTQIIVMVVSLNGKIKKLQSFYNQKPLVKQKYEILNWQNNFWCVERRLTYKINTSTHK